MSYKTCDSRKHQKHFFGNVLDDIFHEATNAFRNDFHKTIPTVNITENDKSFKVSVAAPGYSKEDFIVKIHEDTLTISVKKNDKEEEESKEKYKRKEFDYGSFKRRFRLYENIDTDNVKAKYKNGILELTLPKKKVVEEEAKNIKVD